jgi:aryl-alcohol dehydrogenase-like predicted oxidoreductase
MEYAKIKDVTNPVSRIIFGAATQQMWSGGDASEALDAAFEAGITTFDTARGYGGSEASLGNWVTKRENRDKINIITKGCMIDGTDIKITPDLIKKEISESLQNLKMNFVDIYFLHKDDRTSEVGAIIETLNELQAAGKIGIFGVSNWKRNRIEEAGEYAYKKGLNSFTVAQQCYSYLEQIEDPFDSVCLAGDKNKEEREWYIRNQIPVFAYSALARGFLSGRVKSTDTIVQVKDMFIEGFIKEYYHPQNMERLSRLEKMADKKGLSVAELALVYLFHAPFDVYAITSPSAKHALATADTVGVKLSEQEYLWLDQGIEQ